MNAQELRQARQTLGLSCREFALITGTCDGRMIRRYEKGTTRVPPTLELLIRCLVMFPAARRLAWELADQRATPIKSSPPQTPKPGLQD